MSKAIKTQSADQRKVLLDAVRYYLRRCFPIVPVTPREKIPSLKDWTNAASNRPDVVEKWWRERPDSNIGLTTGEGSGFFVLDVDGEDGLASLRALEAEHGELPKTVTVLTGGGGMHFYFKCRDSGIRNSAGVVGDHLDIRANGGFVVVPPSVHPNGKRYEFDAEGHLKDVKIAEPPAWLLDAIKKPSGADTNGRAAPEIPEAIPQGKRNATLASLAGTMRRRGASEDAIAAALIEENRKCRPPLAEGEVEAIAKSVGRYEPTKQADAEPVDEAITRINETCAVIVIGSKVVVLRERPGGHGIDLLSRQGFETLFANEIVKVGKTEKPLGKAWITSPNRREIQKIEFDPTNSVGPEVYNLWRGFAVEPKEGDCNLFLLHVHDVICAGSEALYGWVLSWMADAVQNPASLPGTCLAMRGGQGIGKGIYATGFGSLFAPHFLHMSHMGQSVGRFNSHLQANLLIFIDEALSTGDRQGMASLKRLITEPTLFIEAKGHEPYEVQNFARVVIASNEQAILPAAIDERRFCVLDVSADRRGDGPYFERLVRSMEDGGREALLHTLLNHEIDVDLRRVPKTAALTEQKLEHLDCVARFFEEVLGKGVLDENDWPDRIGCDALYEKYLKFCERVGIRTPRSQIGFGRRTRIMGIGFDRERDGSGERKWTYAVPSVQDTRDAFGRMLGGPIEW